ncbi:hypothetical protein N9Z41_00925 [bacterium]|nr:hypothetical protein [bacterium]
MTYLSSNIVYNNNIAYKILNIIPIHNFINKDGSVNKQVLGLYVHEKGGDHVLQRDHQFLICETIEEATVVEENTL